MSWVMDREIIDAPRGVRRWRVLLIEDDEDDFLLTRELFDEFERPADFELEWAQRYDEGLAALVSGEHDICLLDYRLGAQDGLQLLQEAMKAGVKRPIVLLTGSGDRRVDQEAMRRGAADYLVKEEITAVLLERSLRHSMERHRLVEGQRFLAAAGMQLTSTLDFEETLESVAQLSAEALADYCAIDIVAEDGEAVRLSVGAREGADGKVQQWLRKNPFLDSTQSLVGQTLRRGEPVLVSEVNEEFLQDLATTGERREMLARLSPVSLMAVPMRAGDRLVGSILFISTEPRRRYDQTDLTLAEQLGFRAGLAMDNARLYKEARRAIELRDEVHRIVVHDLRNPLSTMGLAVQLMERKIRKGAPLESFTEQLETQRISIGRMNRLIDDLLDVAKIENGKIALSLGPCSPKVVIENVRNQHKIKADEQGIALTVDVEEGLAMADADMRRLEQVLTNLVDNALKFTPEGGQIRLVAKAENEGINFSVEDTGYGISKTQLPHLFDRFWQAEHGAFNGAGLGLAICKGLVDAHGGRIWAESEEGEGAIFSFTLPAYRDSNPFR